MHISYSVRLDHPARKMARGERQKASLVAGADPLKSQLRRSGGQFSTPRGIKCLDPEEIKTSLTVRCPVISIHYNLSACFMDSWTHAMS